MALNPLEKQTPKPVQPSKDERPYAAVFLDEESQEKLLEWWEVILGIPFHPLVQAHHMTIKYDPNEAEILGIEVGAPASMRVVGYASDAKGQAVLVRPTVYSYNAHPHVTVATAVGVGAVYSNELLENSVKYVGGPTLTGIVDIRID
jgi:hypothetical protein